jgi:hypothetical protein
VAEGPASPVSTSAKPSTDAPGGRAAGRIIRRTVKERESYATGCACAHRWKAAPSDQRGRLHVYECSRCGRVLERKSDLTRREKREPYLRCDRGAGLVPCTWPECVREPRKLGQKFNDGLTRLSWAIDTMTE